MSKVLDLISALLANTGTGIASQTASPPSGDRTKKLATTEWFGQEFTGTGKQQLANPGYQVLPGGLILQWGTETSVSAGGNKLVTLPITFPNAILGGSATINTGSTTSVGNYSAYIAFTSTSQIRVHNDDNVTSGAVAQNIAWFVIGY